MKSNTPKDMFLNIVAVVVVTLAAMFFCISWLNVVVDASRGIPWENFAFAFGIVVLVAVLMFVVGWAFRRMFSGR